MSVHGEKNLFSAGVDRLNSVSFDTLGQVDETENRETHRHTRVQGLQPEETRKFLEPRKTIVIDRDTSLVRHPHQKGLLK